MAVCSLTSVHIAMTPHAKNSGSPTTQKKPMPSWPACAKASRMESANSTFPCARNDRKNSRRAGRAMSAPMLGYADPIEPQDGERAETDDENLQNGAHALRLRG